MDARADNQPCSTLSTQRADAPLVLETLARVGVPAAVCAADGSIALATEDFRELMSVRRFVVEQDGRLHAASRRCDDHLQAAFRESAATAEVVPVLLQDEDEFAVARLRDLRLDGDTTCQSWRLVSLPQSLKCPSGLLGLLGLTEAEQEITRLMALGVTPCEIATYRKVTIATVRAQIQAIFIKLGVNRQANLVTKLRHVL